MSASIAVEQQEAIDQAKRATSESLRLIIEIRADVAPGLCPWCDRLLPPRRRAAGRAPLRCQRRECKRAYDDAYQSVWRREKSSARNRSRDPEGIP